MKPCPSPDLQIHGLTSSLLTWTTFGGLTGRFAHPAKSLKSPSQQALWQSRAKQHMDGSNCHGSCSPLCLLEVAL